VITFESGAVEVPRPKKAKVGTEGSAVSTRVRFLHCVH
jgi:hypothetical protein